MRIGILSSHPIQYQAPWFRELAKRASVEVFFALQPSAKEQGAGFGSVFAWDIDLLSGYQHRFLGNRAAHPSTERFGGCDTPEIADIIASERFDAFIVCGWNLKTYWQAVRACRRQAVPVLVRGDSQLHTPRSTLIRLAKDFVYPRLLRQFDRFLSVGTRNREYLVHYGVPDDRIFFAPHFVDNEWFRAQSAAAARERRPALREKWGIDADGLVAIFVGKFIPEKRPADLLHASSRARGKGVQVTPVFVGAGELDATLRKVANELRVPARFEGFRNQTELPQYYASADFLVLPSESETWGLVVNEAMACGIPAIVSSVVGCVPDLIENGTTGYDYPMGDIAALAERFVPARSIPAAPLKFALARKLNIYSATTCSDNTLMACAQSQKLAGKWNG